MRTVIGLTGFAGSGKDEAAKALIEERGFTKVSFAEPLRRAMSALNPIVGKRVHSGTLFPETERDVRYRDAVLTYGYDEAKKKFPEMRTLLQRFGTEVGRDQFGVNFWTDMAKREIDRIPETIPIVITDVRFPNEIEIVRSFHGLMVRIERPSVNAVNTHVSDTNTTGLKVDLILKNNGTIEDLRRMILQAYENRFVGAVRPVEYCDGYEQLQLPVSEVSNA